LVIAAIELEEKIEKKGFFENWPVRYLFVEKIEKKTMMLLL